MKNILVIGAAGQIGSELVPELRRRGYMTVAAGSGRTPLTAALSEGGPTAVVNLLDADGLRRTVEDYAIDTIFNMAAILSAVGESKPMTAWDIGVNGVIGLLELARDKNLSVFTPSSIGVFGPETPHDPTPQDTVCRPRTMYGITKVAGELLSDYYRAKYGVDARSVRYPGLISHVTPPGGGTTDYAVDIYWKAVEHGRYASPLAEGTRLPMMFMADALRAAIELMEADASRLRHFNSFNVGAMSFAPEDVAASYPPDRRVQQSTDAPTRAFIDYVQSQPLIRAVLAGHLHYDFETRLSGGAVQIVTGGGFRGCAREIAFF